MLAGFLFNSRYSIGSDTARYVVGYKYLVVSTMYVWYRLSIINSIFQSRY